VGADEVSDADRKQRILDAVQANPTVSKTDLAKIVGGRRETTLRAINELLGQNKIALGAKPAVAIGREVRFAPTKPELKRWQRDLDQAELLERLHVGLLADLKAERKRHPKPKPHGKPKRSGDAIVREIAPVDLHVGKYAWDDEVGASYDVQIAESVFTGAVTDIDERSARAIDTLGETILVVGNDLLQTDNLNGTTTAGTYVDTDTRYIRSFRRAFRINRWAIDRLADRGNVRVVVVPGNHDRLTAFQLGHSLESWYHDDPRVVIDNRPKLRKYRLVGINLLGWTHGSEEKEESLPLVMPVEEPELWAKSLHREWHIGHFHKAKETRYTAGDSFNGVRVRILPALCGPDAWHYAKGYVGGLPACESYLWHPRQGFAGMISSNVLPEPSTPSSFRGRAA
jgi:hypothetical protein